MQPRVLIICERAAERETIRVLVGTMGCQWVVASSIEEALAMLSRERISAVLLELPGAVSDPDQIHKNVREFLVRFPGRVMALTDGMPTPAISELIFKYSIPRSEEHTSELQSQSNLVCRLLLEKKKK